MKFLVLCGLLFVIPIRSNAILITLENMSETTADLTLDWSDGTVRNVGVSGTSDMWALIYDRVASPTSFINIIVHTVVAPLPMISLQIGWSDPAAAAIHFSYYDIWTPLFASVTEQSSTAITFHLDRDPGSSSGQNIVAVPESGSSILLLLIGLGAIALFRYRLACTARSTTAA